jgi:transposase
MMGQLSSGQERLFYSFNLEDHIPANHLLRSIDQCLDLIYLRHYLADFYSPIGRPSVDLELMIRMLIVGYCYGIRSERRLCEEAHLNLAYRWFCRLSLEDEVPNHSTFSKNRHGRFRDSDLFRWLFNEVLRRCMDAGLVKGEGFAVDASIIKADASRQSGVPGDEPVTCHGIGAPALSKKPQINPLTEQQRSTKGRETTQCGESVLRRWSCLSSGQLKIRLFQQNRPEAVMFRPLCKSTTPPRKGC